MERNVERHQERTLSAIAASARAAKSTGRAYIKCVTPTKGQRYVYLMGRKGLAETKTRIQNSIHVFWFFEPGTASEVDALAAAKHFVKRRPNARLSVSEACAGVCRELPVILPFGDRDKVCLLEHEKAVLWKVWQGLAIDDLEGEDLDELGLAAKTTDGAWLLSVAGEEKVRELWGAEVAA